MVLAMAAVLLAFAGPDAATQFERTISATYDGWSELPDGSYDLVFGYMNRNPSEIEIPLGPNNTIDPAPADQGQPTNFLPGRQRDCLTLRYYYDMSPAQIADGLDLSVNSVKTHLQRGLKALATILEEKR